jgi:hypothetical protein
MSFNRSYKVNLAMSPSSVSEEAALMALTITNSSGSLKPWKYITRIFLKFVNIVFCLHIKKKKKNQDSIAGIG